MMSTSEPGLLKNMIDGGRTSLEGSWNNLESWERREFELSSP
jgi:hypothetical protein